MLYKNHEYLKLIKNKIYLLKTALEKTDTLLLKNYGILLY